MLEQAERYARMTLLPLISAHTPKIFSDIVNTFTAHDGPKYLPLEFEDVELTTKKVVLIENTVPSNVSDNYTEISTKSALVDRIANYSVNEGRSNEGVFIVYPQNYVPTAEASIDRSFSETNDVEEKSRLNLGEILLGAINVSTTTVATKSDRKHKLYVNLPVYNESELIKINETTTTKYIPLNFEEGQSSN